MDEKSVRKSHGHHIPPAKGMGERALLLLGLLSLLTAADEMRHADAQHRATSDPSEGHAVEAGQREADGLGVADVDGDLTGGGVGAGAIRTGQLIVSVIAVELTEGDVGAALVGLGNRRREAVTFMLASSYVAVMVKVKGLALVYFSLGAWTSVTL